MKKTRLTSGISEQFKTGEPQRGMFNLTTVEA